MIPPRLKTILGLSIPSFIAHGLEEYFTGFYHIDPSIQYIFGGLGFNLASTFLVFQIVFWLLLILGFILIRKNILPKILSFTGGILILFEFWHIFKVISVGGYYPGLVTALGFPIFAFFFWKEIWRELRHAQR